MKRFNIDIFDWSDNGYEPESWAELKLTDDALYVKMTSVERNPRGTYVTGPDVEACEDSCLEFFFSLNGSRYYLNLEMNPCGGYFCAYRTGRDDPHFVDYIFTENGKPHGTVLEDRWFAEAVIDLEALKKLFGIDEITSLKANFYKCGEFTEFPHYGMWNRIVLNENEEPDYHRPEFFSEIPLEDIR